MNKLTSVFIATALFLSACATQNNGQQVGGLLGGVAGGVLGSQFGEGSGKTAATIGGALLGVWAGSKIGANMTQQDRGYHSSASQQAYAAPVGETIAWDNPQSGHSGTVTPVRDGRAASGAYCREFQQTVTIDGRTERAFGTACQQPDGSWQIVN